MSKTTSSETAQSAVSMPFAVGCGGEEELSMDPESMAVAYMKAFIECDTDAALDAANIDAIKDMLWYYSGYDYSYSEFEDMWSSIEYDKGKVVSTGCGRALDRRFAAFCASGASNCGTAAVTQPGRIDCGAKSGSNAATPPASELRTLMLQ